MFTGIITDVGTVEAVVEKPGGERVFRISTTYYTPGIGLGASISCNGICLTVINKGENWFEVLASGETLSLTTCGSWKEGDAINLERALKLGDEFGGHVVTGHIDGVARIMKFEQEGESWRLEAEAPKEFASHIARKGSVALDGVSLTVNRIEGNHFSVNLIPHTIENTNLKHKKAGDSLNLEIDIFARYLARLLEQDK